MLVVLFVLVLVCEVLLQSDQSLSSQISYGTLISLMVPQSLVFALSTESLQPDFTDASTVNFTLPSISFLIIHCYLR